MLNIGDIVQIRDGMRYGSIVGFYRDDRDILHVEHTEYSDARHDCNGKSLYGYGWNYPRHSLRKVELEEAEQLFFKGIIPHKFIVTFINVSQQV